ncbi:hypothetical protein OKW50_007753 [Paraburkholderia youngii]|uniref:hypothetical protein n=1 Tax=Paraburkholderia youngii TaxID=2782701 RepID=UPI003D1D0B43
MKTGLARTGQLRALFAASMLCALLLPAVEQAHGETWDHEEDWEVTGEHGIFPTTEYRHCEDRIVSIDSPNAKNWKIEHDYQVVKKDDDASFTFNKDSDQRIEWHACANNCMFSCDSVKLHLQWRVVPIDPHAAAVAKPPVRVNAPSSPAPTPPERPSNPAELRAPH